jgi:undecaprenyl phosphate-alpha-L-ara4N flippase subunit ArnE
VTPLGFLLVMLSEGCSAAGQILFKRAMAHDQTRMALVLTIGIIAKAVGVFLWVGVMSRVQLSYLYPFDAFSGVLLMIAASLFLKEKMTPSLWVGVVLICTGVLLVSRS